MARVTLSEMKTIYPPLALIVQWRESGLTPAEIHARCLAISRSIRVNRKCVICGAKHEARGYCQHHYYLWRKGKL
jgi:hypothetical protein